MLEWTNTPHSSNVEAVGYDPETQDMRVRFKSGGEYAWTGISRQQAAALAGDRSPGSYLNREFPKGKKV